MRGDDRSPIPGGRGRVAGPVAASLPTLLVLGALATLLAGCPARPEPTAETSPSPAPRLPEPPFLLPLADEPLREPPREGLSIGRYGGELVLPTPSDPKTFNPLLADEQSTTDVLFPLVYTTLVRWDPLSQREEPELATGWEPSADGRTWLLTLRRGVRWSDGTPFDADDVVFSLQVLFDPAIPNSLADLFKDSQGRLPEVTKVDAGHVRFTLREPNVLFLAAIGSVYLAPRARLAQHYRAGRLHQAYNVLTPPRELVASGPFRIKTFVPGQRLVLERNPYYWKLDPAGQRLPYLDRVLWVMVPDLNAALLRFQRGEIDLYEEVPADQLDLLERQQAAGGYELRDLGPALTANYLSFNWNPGLRADGKPIVDPVRRAWFADPRFRQAVSHGLDREGIVATVLLGRGRPLYCFDSPSNRRWASDCPRFPHDPGRAGQLLDELGLRDTDADGLRDDGRGHPVRFAITTNAENRERVAVATAIKADLLRIGVQVDLRVLPFNGYVTALRETHDWEALLGAWGAAVPPDPVLSKNVFLSSGQLHLWHPGQTQPASDWERRLDELVGQLSSTLELAARQALYRELSGIFASQQAQIFTYNSNQYVAARRGIGNLQPTVFRPHSYWNAHLLYRER